MKNILKRFLIFSIVLLVSILNTNCYEVVNAITIHEKVEIKEIYKIKDKKEVVISNTIIDYYQNDPKKEEYAKEKMDQEREEKRKIEEERLRKLAIKTNLVNFSLKFVGNPYVSGGTSLTNGADCSGFVQSIYKYFGYSLPRTTVEQAVIGLEVSIEEIELGDIVSYGYNGFATHSAIYIGEGKIIHSSTPEMGIRIDNISILPILTIRRVI